mgnify:CR=1 FL=1
MSKQDLDAKHCPLCGNVNLCEMVATGDGEGCWCREECFSETLLAQIPATQRRKACICRECARAFNANYYDATGESTQL